VTLADVVVGVRAMDDQAADAFADGAVPNTRRTGWWDRPASLRHSPGQKAAARQRTGESGDGRV
jgi:hypothetical protein